MRPLIHLALALALVATGCAVTVDDPSPECAPADTYCIDDFNIASCDRGVFVGSDCDDVCYDAGFSYTTGCGYDPTVGLDSCFCQ